MEGFFRLGTTFFFFFLRIQLGLGSSWALLSSGPAVVDVTCKQWRKDSSHRGILIVGQFHLILGFFEHSGEYFGQPSAGSGRRFLLLLLRLFLLLLLFRFGFRCTARRRHRFWLIHRSAAANVFVAMSRLLITQRNGGERDTHTHTQKKNNIIIIIIIIMKDRSADVIADVNECRTTSTIHRL